jgi:hypothetical protein
MSGFLSNLAAVGGGLAATGSTGNNTHASAKLAPAASKVAVVFVTENAGTTITLAIQGSLDPDTVSDANANWFPLVTLTTVDDTASSTIAAITTQIARVFWLSQAHSRFARRIRIVTTANTGFNYHADLHQQYSN